MQSKDIRRCPISILAGILSVLVGATSTTAAAAANVYYFPSAYPKVCAQNLTTGEAQCPPGVNASAPAFCAASVVGLDLARSALGLGSCSGEGSPSDLPGINLLLLVDDRTLSKEAQEVFGDAIRDLGSGPLVFPSRTPHGAERQAVIIGERFYRQDFESGDSEKWAMHVRDLTTETRPQSIGQSAARNVTLTPSSPGPEAWMTSSFRFDLPNLPCEKVHRIDLIGWRHTPAAVEMSELKLAISMADHSPWSDWADAVLVKGQVDRPSRDASLIFYDPSFARELAEINFHDVSIVSIKVLPATVDKEGPSRFEVELSVERVELSVEKTKGKAASR